MCSITTLKQLFEEKIPTNMDKECQVIPTNGKKEY